MKRIPIRVIVQAHIRVKTNQRDGRIRGNKKLIDVLKITMIWIILMTSMRRITAVEGEEARKVPKGWIVTHPDLELTQMVNIGNRHRGTVCNQFQHRLRESLLKHHRISSWSLPVK